MRIKWLGCRDIQLATILFGVQCSKETKHKLLETNYSFSDKVKNFSTLPNDTGFKENNNIHMMSKCKSLDIFNSSSKYSMDNTKERRKTKIPRLTVYFRSVPYHLI